MKIHLFAGTYPIFPVSFVEDYFFSIKNFCRKSTDHKSKDLFLDSLPFHGLHVYPALALHCLNYCGFILCFEKWKITPPNLLI